MLNPIQLANLQAAADAAVRAETADPQIHIPAALTVSQWALESGWGAHQPGNNPFGIKARAGDPYTRKTTTEFIHGCEVRIEQNFESFPDLAAAFTRHNELLTHAPYWAAAKVYQQTQDFFALVRGIGAHYATDPDYADKILAMSQRVDIQQAIQKARENV